MKVVDFLDISLPLENCVDTSDMTPVETKTSPNLFKFKIYSCKMYI